MIRFTDYDLAYTQTKDVYDMIKNEGTNVILDLEKIIEGLTEKWHGEDAPKHINELVKVQNGLHNCLNNAMDMAIEASDRTVAVQEVVNKVSGSVVVQDRLKNDFEENKKHEESREERQYKLQSLKEEYELLNNVCTNYTLLKTKYAELFNEFFDNWKGDPQKERVEKLFDEFSTTMEGYKKGLEDTRIALATAVQNTEQLLEE